MYVTTNITNFPHRNESNIQCPTLWSSFPGIIPPLPKSFTFIEQCICLAHILFLGFHLLLNLNLKTYYIPQYYNKSLVCNPSHKKFFQKSSSPPETYTPQQSTLTLELTTLSIMHNSSQQINNYENRIQTSHPHCLFNVFLTINGTWQTMNLEPFIISILMHN